MTNERIIKVEVTTRHLLANYSSDLFVTTPYQVENPWHDILSNGFYTTLFAQGKEGSHGPR